MRLHIDLETYSSEDLKTAGVYRYCESFDFEILLFAYSVDSDPVHVVDLARGGTIPKHIIAMLLDPTVRKHAHNATFERIALNSMGLHTTADQWDCSMIKAAYCGLPLSLSDVSKALSLNEKSKSSSGTALINYFCKPCKPSKANGMRRRNLPSHDPEKWAQFIEYCKQDVVAEKAVTETLAGTIIPDFEKKLYVLDQKINDTGVLIDLELVGTCIDLDCSNISKLIGQMKNLTGLANPNSPAQLKTWIGGELGEPVESLAKDAVEQMLQDTDSEEVKEVLQLRQRTAKTSIKKYQAMQDSACEDGRGRGFFQFYGAYRSGRWAGRRVQLQNLPRNYINDLGEVRDSVKLGTYDAANGISNTLSQLIRTSFVAPKGKTLIAADFSAIEARVIAWLAGEEWRLEVFRSHGKIYEASAAMMYGVPVETVTKGSPLRQKGKIAELALGYQGGVGAMRKMGAEDVGLTESDMQGIVNKWRLKSPRIVRLWKDIQTTVVQAIAHKKQIALPEYRGLTIGAHAHALYIELPSGRRLHYRSPKIERPNSWKTDIKYMGLNEKRQWGYVDSYGGKFVENIVQGIARDVLAETMAVLDAEGYEIIMHVHDEVVVEINEEHAEEHMGRVCDLMGNPIYWANGLPLRADGFVSKYYKKE